MAHDVMIASAKMDRQKAELVAGRLRALKFTVRLDTRRDHTTPSARDLNETNKSGAVLVLWSRSACDTESPDSEWVYAIANLARSRPEQLVQADLDQTVPADPFDKDERFKLSGLGPRRMPKEFDALVDALGEIHGRSGLSRWMRLSPGDRAKRDAWKAEHPDDPLSQKRQRRATRGAGAYSAVSKPWQNDSVNQDDAPASAPAAVPAAAAELTEASERVRTAAQAHQARQAAPVEKPATGWAILAPVLGGIALMIGFAWAAGSEGPIGQPSQTVAGASSGATLAATCPPGEMPRSLIEVEPRESDIAPPEE